MVTGTSSVSEGTRALVIWMRTVYLVEMMGLSMVVHSVGIVMKYRFLNSDGLPLESSRTDDAMTAFCFTRLCWPSYGSDSSKRCSTVNRRDLTCMPWTCVGFLPWLMGRNRHSTVTELRDESRRLHVQ